MEDDAKAYSALNKPQFDDGCDFVRSLKISEGDKVLDMGCGTGEVTNFIASLVGPRGEVVGVDPDEERIEIAREKFKHVENLDFVVGDSSSKLPHDNQDYYDLHFSSNVFHWCVGEEKKKYIEKAFQCLKSRGRLAILTTLKEHCLGCNNQLSTIEYFTEAEYKQVVEDFLFNIVSNEVSDFTAYYSDFQEYTSWYKATFHDDGGNLDSSYRKTLEKSMTIAANGNIILDIPNLHLRLVAYKQEI